MLNLIVAGSRHFQDYALLARKLDQLTVNHDSVRVISGRCSGADELGEQWALERGHDILPIPAEWERYRATPGLSLKQAGHDRNVKMAEKADACIVFWNGQKQNSGSYDMMTVAQEYNVDLRVCRID